MIEKTRLYNKLYTNIPLISLLTAFIVAYAGYEIALEENAQGNLPDGSALGGWFAGFFAGFFGSAYGSLLALKAADRLANKFYSSCSKNNTEKSS